MNDSRPTLWHIGISHYSEKARWTLDYKEGRHHPWGPHPGGDVAHPQHRQLHLPGPAHIRLLAFHELGKDPERFEAVIKRAGPASLARMSSGAVSYARTFTSLRFGVRSEEAAERARGKVLAALDRLEAELGSDEYLVGDSFSVADLTAAALFYPLVVPEGGPLPTDEPGPKGLERFRAPLKERRGFEWVEEMFRRHRDAAVPVRVMA